jgi:hypothetical protein
LRISPLHDVELLIMIFLLLNSVLGGKRNLEENVTDSETNENPQKKTFSRDTAEEG